MASNLYEALDFSAYPKGIIQPRKEPMEVLCLGLPRTGTMSVSLALNKLGIKTYDMSEAMRHSVNGSLKRWREGAEANYFNGLGKKITYKQDLDDLLYQYQAVSSMPSVLFSDQLVKAYPSAKVILTEIDYDAWLMAMDQSYYSIINDQSSNRLLSLDSDYKQNFIPLLRSALRIWTKNDENNRVALREGFRRHYQHIREIVPKEQLLIFNPKDGWGPLCEFLGKSTPKDKFPLIDESATASSLHSNVFVKQKFKGVLQKLLTILLPLLLVAVTVYKFMPQIQERLRR